VAGSMIHASRSPHRWIIGEIELDPVGDLLGTPGRRPAPILASPVTATDPPYIRTCDGHPVHFRHSASETVLDVLAERIVDGELRHFGSPSTPIGVPLGSQGSVVQGTAAGGGVPTQFPRDRGWRTVKPSGDRAHAVGAGAQERDFLPLDEG
jgi:hypothetical protein